MPGHELYDHIERRELMDVVESGIFMRYGFDGTRKCAAAIKSALYK